MFQKSMLYSHWLHVDLTTLKQNDLVKPYNSWVVFHIYCHYYFPKAQKLPTDTIVGLVCLLFTKTVFCFLKLLSPEHIWKWAHFCFLKVCFLRTWQRILEEKRREWEKNTCLGNNFHNVIDFTWEINCSVWNCFIKQF